MLTYNEYRKKIEERYKIEKKHKKIVEQFIGERELWIWGASEKSYWLSKTFNNIKGYIDRDEQKTVYRGKKVIQPSEINYKEMYVYVALENKYTEVEHLLNQKGMKEYVDYLYFGRSTIVLYGCDNGYVDVYGNEIKGSFSETIVRFDRGVGSVLVIGKNCNIASKAVFRLEQDSIVILEDDVVLEEDVIIDARNGGVIRIGKGSKIMRGNVINCYRSSYVDIGACFTMCPWGIVNAAQHSRVSIGEDVLFSTNCHVQACDGHQFYDLETKQSICERKNYEIEIGNHVWIGRSCSILYGAKIGSGSIVGIDSMVKESVPANVVVAGRLAKVVRENVVWEMAGVPREDNFEELMIYDYRN